MIKNIKVDWGQMGWDCMRVRSCWVRWLTSCWGTSLMRYKCVPPHSIGCSVRRWNSISSDTLLNECSFVRTLPLGSTSIRCLCSPPCMAVSTYWPAAVELSRTRKSPSHTTNSLLLSRDMTPWNHGSSCNPRPIWDGVGSLYSESSSGTGSV